MSLTTEFYKMGTDPHLDEAALTRAAAIIRDGGLVGMPTETVYGLAASAFNEHAAERSTRPKGVRRIIR